MRATFDLPDDLYRRVNARCVLEGRPVSAVAIELLHTWWETAVSTPLEAG